MNFYKHCHFNHESLNQGCFGKLKYDKKLPEKGHPVSATSLSIIFQHALEKNLFTNLSN